MHSAVSVRPIQPLRGLPPLLPPLLQKPGGQDAWAPALLHHAHSSEAAALGAALLRMGAAEASHPLFQAGVSGSMQHLAGAVSLQVGGSRCLLLGGQLRVQAGAHARAQAQALLQASAAAAAQGSNAPPAHGTTHPAS